MGRSTLLAISLLYGACANAQPLPRVTLDVAFEMPAGFGLRFTAQGPRVAVAEDGTIVVVVAEHGRSDGKETEQLEAIGFDREGRQKFRVTLLQLQQDSNGKSEGWPTTRLGVAIAHSGDIAVFSGAYLPNGIKARLFRLAADGTIRHRSLVRGLGNPPDSLDHFAIERFVATPDDGLMLAGGYGLGPEAWWLGKFTLDGTVVWADGPGPSLPGRVFDVGVRSDGSWLALLYESSTGGDGNYLVVYDRNGHRLSRKRIADDRQREVGALALADLPEGKTVTLDKHHDGIATDHGGPIERIGRGGELRWRSAPGIYSDAVIAPDGQVVALVWPKTSSDADTSLRLVRLADP